MSATAARAKAPVEELEVAAYTVPTDAPEADGTLSWDSTTIVVVHAYGAGEWGLGYTYADVATAKLIESKLAGVVQGGDAMSPQGAWKAMVGAIRNLGRPGIASMAIAAVDVALWDLKARLLRLPLCSLIGAVQERVPIYGSGGFTAYSIARLCRQLAGWVDRGIPRVKMKVGSSPGDDPERVRAAREAIGPNTELFVDANGAYSSKQALALAERFRSDAGVSWFEEPVSSDDLDGLRLLRDRAPAGMAIAAGEYGYDEPYFRRMLEAGAVDVLQADVTRCAGITGADDHGARLATRRAHVHARSVRPPRRASRTPARSRGRSRRRHPLPRLPLVQPSRHPRQVGNELVHRSPALGILPRSEDRGRVRGHGDQLCEVGVDRLSAIASDPDLGSQQGLCGRRAEQNQRPRAHHLELGPQPRQTGRYLPAVWTLVNPALTPRLVAEMLDHVGDVDIVMRDARSLQAAVEDAAGGADERMALNVLLVPRLLTDQHQARVLRTLAHHGLRGTFPEVTGAAFLDCAPHARRRGARGDRRGWSFGGWVVIGRGHAAGLPKR
jgi:L-alanine-DL-glutamate epimerase-like enolase superfamily enzyme